MAAVGAEPERKEAVALAVYDKMWGLAVRVKDCLKHLGWTGPWEALIERVASRLLRPPSYEVKVTLPFGLTLLGPPGSPSARTYVHGLYEREVTKLIVGFLRDGMSMVDVGAYCGYYTLLASRLVGEQGKVYAFEPDPLAYAYLLTNVKVNRCTNIQAVRAAVWRESTRLTFRCARERGYIIGRNLSRVAGTVVVDSVTLDELFCQRSWPRIDLVKVDVEGAEPAVFEGMREPVRRNPSLALIAEYNPSTLRQVGYTIGDFITALESIGFKHAHIIERGLSAVSIAEGLPVNSGMYNLLLHNPNCTIVCDNDQ